MRWYISRLNTVHTKNSKKMKIKYQANMGWIATLRRAWNLKPLLRSITNSGGGCVSVPLPTYLQANKHIMIAQHNVRCLLLVVLSRLRACAAMHCKVYDKNAWDTYLHWTDCLCCLRWMYIVPTCRCLSYGWYGLCAAA